MKIKKCKIRIEKKMNQELIYTILKILIFIPILYYIGYNIFFENKLSYKMNIFIIIVFTSILLSHFMDIVNLINTTIKGKNFNKGFGFFIMCLATFLLLFNIHKILRIQKIIIF